MAKELERKREERREAIEKETQRAKCEVRKNRESRVKLQTQIVKTKDGKHV